MFKCDHCLLEMPESRAIHDRIKGEEKTFCCHGCMGIARLIGKEGLEEFYRSRNSSWTPGPPREDTIDPSAFSGALKEDGDEIEADVILDGIRCASCIWLVEKILLGTEGVTYAKVNYATHRATIRWNKAITDIGRVAARITSIGYIPKPFLAVEYEEALKRQQRDLLIRFGTAAFFSMQLMMYSVALYAGYFQGISEGTKKVLQVISLFLATPVVFYSGMPFIMGMVRGLKNMVLNMDVLIITGTGSAYVYSIYQIFSGGEVYFDTSAMIITLILLGRYIETGAKGKASEVITRLLSLNPKEARVVKSMGSGVRSSDLVQISSIKEGEWIEVRPGERIPLDGTVSEGSSEIDESMLTGESKTIAKTLGSEVFCGTQNLFGNIIFRVNRTGGNTVLAQIVKTVEDAQARQSPVQTLVDRVVGFFVPAVLLLSVITGISWFYYGSDAAQALMNAVSVLVIACPCALGLATPLAILVGTTQGASKGILIKGGEIIERAKNIDTVVLDKTGTITEGKQELSSYTGIGIDDKEALRLAASLERFSEHSISNAIVNASADMPPYDVTGFSASPGRGIKGIVAGKDVLIGSRDMIELEGIFNGIESVLTPELLSWLELHEHSGATVIYLSFENKLAGVFAVSDSVRAEARDAIAKLKKMRHDVIMITGDSYHTALKVAGEVDLDIEGVMAERSPLEKAEAIQAMHKEGKSVLMVGDGINDAPALIQADVGIAMGRATDIALESADMVLMKNDLNLVPDAIMLAKRIHAVIKQNLFWAFIYNIIALPLAVAGILHPVVAAVSMTFSSLSVVGNSMRLKKA